MSRAIGPLASFDEKALRELAPRGAARSYPKNAVVINEGDQTDSLYILLSGRAKVFVSEEDGREVVLSTIREGDYFGELVLDGGPRSASIMTLEPCRCFVIPLGDIEGLLERNPLFAGHLIHMLIGRVRSLVKKVGDLALKDVYGRFAKFVDEKRDRTKRGASGARTPDAAGYRRAYRRLARDGESYRQGPDRGRLHFGRRQADHGSQETAGAMVRARARAPRRAAVL
jgi:CRP/FNR family cyclic AMP-dependent transcriptional regulator